MQTKKIFFLLLSSFFIHSLFGQIIDTSKLVLSDKILFNFGKYELTHSADSTINEVFTQIQSFKNYEIKITAHTDAIGSNENNMTLSQNRANAVSYFLIQKGILSSVISTHIFGEEKPESDNETEFGRQLNRRVTIDVIQKTKLVVIKGQIIDTETKKPVIADVIIRTKEKQDSLHTDSLGNFNALLPFGVVGGLDVFAKGYFFETQMFKVKPGKKNDFSIQLKKAEVGQKIDLKNLYYIGNQAILLKRSLPELPKLLKFMELNDSIKIEIAGHINRPNYPEVDKLSWDFKLSVKRAKMVHDYLLTNEISTERISYKGYGNSQKRYPKARTEGEQAQNRRVEIIVVEKNGTY